MTNDSKIIVFGIILLGGHVVSLLTGDNGIIFFLGFLFLIFILDDISYQLKNRNIIEKEKIRRKKK